MFVGYFILVACVVGNSGYVCWPHDASVLKISSIERCSAHTHTHNSAAVWRNKPRGLQGTFLGLQLYITALC